MSPLVITIIITIGLAVLYCSGKVPFGLASFICILALCMSGVLTVAEAFGGFINTNVLLVAAMFVVTKGMNKTTILDRIKDLMASSRGKENRLCLFSCICASLIAIVSNGTTAAVILMPIVIAMAREIGSSRSRFLWPMQVCACCALSMTVLGAGAANLTRNAFIENAGGTVLFKMSDFTMVKLPIVIITIIFMYFVGYKLMPTIPEESLDSASADTKARSTLPPVKNKIAIAIVAVTFIGILTSTYTKIPLYYFAFVGAALMVACGILTEKEAFASINMPTIFIFASTLQLASAMNKTGAGEVISELLVKLVGSNTNSVVIVAIFYIVGFVITQFMSNTAVAALITPIAANAAVAMGMDPRAAVMACAIGACASFLTPMASPAMAIVFGPGGYKLSHWLKAGIPIAIIQMVFAIPYIAFLFPAFG